VKGKKYLYITATSSYKGQKKRFEKSIGPADAPKEELEHKKEFYSDLLELKSVLHKVHMEAKDKDFKYLPKFYAIYLSLIRNFYSRFLSDLYPSELEKYKDNQKIKYIHHTTALEGNTLTLREAALVIEDGIAPKGKKLREIHEVENFKSLTRFMRYYKGDITIPMIKKVHGLVQRNIDDEQAGNFRRIEVGVVGSKFTPPPAIFIEEELTGLIDWYKENSDRLHSFELAGIFHYRFVQIHPFVDGNGRVARELMNFILEKNDYPPLIFEVTDREDYLKRLQKADEGDPTPFLEQMALKMITDYEDVIMNFQTKALKDMASLTQEEMGEIFEMLMWFMSLMREFEVDIPEEAKEKIASIQKLSKMMRQPKMIAEK
jgi:fido (protein-threonine AMPylation protein)